MARKTGAAAAVSLALVALLMGGCNGAESNAAVEERPTKNADQPVQQEPPTVDARKTLETISPAIPIYADAQYRADLTRRDEVMIRNQYGPGAEVYTLATDDSYPQVFHYYTTYLGQFRAFPAKDTYPPSNKNWRTLEVQLNQAMQDPFIPGDSIDANGKQVILQIAETEAEPKTVIRYIVTPAGTAAPAATPIASR